MRLPLASSVRSGSRSQRLLIYLPVAAVCFILLAFVRSAWRSGSTGGGVAAEQPTVRADAWHASDSHVRHTNAAAQDDPATRVPDAEHADWVKETASDLASMPFAIPEDHSMTHEQLLREQQCAERPERSLANDVPLPENQKVIIVIGVQKGGTKWLQEALTQNQDIIKPRKKAGSAGEYKEVHYFDSWPLPAFQHWKDAYNFNTSDGRQTWIDASPSYIYNSWAPARIKQLIPRARFVVLLRDPVSRAHSSWRMYRDNRYRATSSFSAMTVQSMQHLLQAQPGCLFAANGLNTRGPAQSWHACYKCEHEQIERDECFTARVPRELQEQCGKMSKRRERGMPGKWYRTQLSNPGQVSIGTYAAQLAWWLQFFPPERFLVVPSALTKDQGNATKVLNAVLDHAGMQDAKRFTGEEFKSEVHVTNKAPPTEGEQITLDVLHELFEVPQQNLWTLLRSQGLGTYMTGVDSFLNAEK